MLGISFSIVLTAGKGVVVFRSSSSHAICWDTDIPASWPVIHLRNPISVYLKSSVFQARVFQILLTCLIRRNTFYISSPHIYTFKNICTIISISQHVTIYMSICISLKEKCLLKNV